MTEWRIDRIDFVKDTKCKFCNRTLKTSVAFILMNEEGAEAPAGPKCATNHSSDPKEKVPDFTKASFDMPIEEEGRSGEGSGTNLHSSTNRTSTPKKEGDKGVEYLRLRIEKLAGFNGASFEKLEEIYTRYASSTSSELTPQDKAYLKNLMTKMEREHSKYSHSNLQTCYAYAFWLEYFLTKEDSEFIRSIIADLKTKLQLTERQLAGANQWLKHQKGVPRFRPDAFMGIR